MKKINVILIVIMLLSITIPGLAVDKSTVVNTVHNLSTSGPGDIKSSTENKVCVFCHTPHNSSPSSPLWNHTFSGDTYTAYNSSTLDTTSSSMAALSGSTTKLCLSCHDGTIALGDLANMNISVSDSSGSKLDADESLANTASANLGTDLSDDHPVLFKPEGDLEVNTKADGVKLYDDVGYLQCTSCHNPHNNTYDNFLVRDNTDSALCTTCHDKTGWTASVHDQYLGCGDCHTPHNANEPVRLKAASEEKLCYQCHDDSGSRYSEWTSIPDIGSVIDNAKASGGSVHPIEDADLTGRHDAVENNTAGDGKVEPTNKHSECSDCHDPHQVTAENPLAGIPGFDLAGGPVSSITNSYELCYKCHQGTTGVQESIDSVKTVFDSRTYTHGNGKGAEQCNKCHGSNSVDVAGEPVHGSNAAGLLTKPQFFDLYNPSTSDLCLRCHDSATNGQQPKIYFTQATGSQHNTKCTACHGDSVNRNSGINKGSQIGVPHGSNKAHILKGDDPKVCLDCHSDKFSGYNTIHDLQDLSYDDGNNGQVAFSNGFNSSTNMKCTACHGNSYNSNQGSQTGKPHGSGQPKLLKNGWDPDFGSEGRGGDSSMCLDCHDSNTYGMNASKSANSGFADRDGGDNLHEEHNDFNCASCHAVHGANNSERRALLKDSASSGSSYNHGSGGDTYLTIYNWRTSGNWGQDDCDHSGCG